MALKRLGNILLTAFDFANILRLLRSMTRIFSWLFLRMTKDTQSSSPDRESTNAIPSPRTRFPGLGHVAEFVRVFGPKAHQWLTKRHSEFGPIYTFGALGRRMVYLFHLDDFLALKKTEGRYPEHFDFKHLRLYRQKNNLPKGLLVSLDNDWSKQRKSVDGPMTRASQLSKYTEFTLEIAHEEVTDLLDHGDPTCTMDSQVTTYVIKAMSRIILGFSTTDDQSTWRDLKEITEISRENFKDAKTLMSIPSCLWGVLPAWWRHTARWDRLLDITRRYIQSVLDTDMDGNSVLGDLLRSSTLTLDEIHLNITDLILASVDTTTSTLLWLLHELSLHPELQQRLRSELNDVTDSEGDISYFNLQQSPYLRAVMRESSRLHPVGFFVSRVTQTETNVHGFSLQKGIHVACSMYTAGRDNNLFNNPDLFHPERWLAKCPDLQTFYGNVPFGFGKRMCVGRKVAELVIMTFIYQFCKTTRFTAVDEETIEPTFRILMVPSQPITLNLQPLS